MDFLSSILQQGPELITTFGSKILAAIAIFFIGYQIAKFLRRIAQNTIDKANMDATLGRFVINLVYYAILVFVLMAALDQIGVDTNSIVAIIGAAGLAAGLAMEGALANFAAGVILIMLRPFKVGDYVEIADISGRVEDIAIVQTRLITFENETVILPNRDITDGKIINFSTRDYVELELSFFVDFDADIEHALDIMNRAAENSEFVIAEPSSGAHVVKMRETAIELLLEANIMPQDRENATFDLTKKIMQGFQQGQVKMPMRRWQTAQAHS